MPARRMPLVPALLAAVLAAALVGCTTAADVDDLPLVSRDAEGIPDELRSVELTALDPSAALDPALLVGWNPSDALPTGSWIDVTWIDGAPECGGQVEAVRVLETDARVVLDLQRAETTTTTDGATCGDVGYPATARIPLERPLLSRELLQHALPER